MTEWKASTSPGFFKPGELSSYDPAAVGFAMSGGGYRATLFHTGAIMRMNELGVLPKLDRIASVSGGSITAGLLARAWKKLQFDPATGVARNLAEEFVKPALQATARTLDISVGIAGYVPFVSAGNRLAALYDKHIFHDMRLSEMPERPKFIFCATNLQTWGLFRFTRDYIADARALFCKNHKIKLSIAVAASSAFTPVLSPVRLDLEGETVTFPKGARYSDPRLHKRPVLVDGGVYDNLGLEPIWKRCGVLISSYAGHNADAVTGNFNFGHMIPVVNTFLAASIDWRERMLGFLMSNKLADGQSERIGTFWNAGTKVGDFPIHDGWKPAPEIFEDAAETPTRLKALSRPEQEKIVFAGYGYADAGIRSYLLPDAAKPAGPPALP